MIENLTKAKPITFNPNSPYVPKQAMIMLVGKTGCGKTNVMTNLVTKYLEYDEIHIYSKHFRDPDDVYVQTLCPMFARIEKKMRRKLKDENYQILFAKESLDDMTEVEDIPYDGKKRVIIIDDMINEGKKENLKKVAEYWTSGRHKGCSCIFLTQSYIKTPKIIRENTSFFCFFKLSRREITEIAKTLANDIEISQFREMFTEATQEPFTFFTIDMTPLAAQYPLLKYRKGLDGLALYDDDEENENLNQL